MMRKLDGVEKEFENKLKSVETQPITFKEVIIRKGFEKFCIRKQAEENAK